MARPQLRKPDVTRPTTPAPLAPSPDNGIPYGTPAPQPSAADTEQAQSASTPPPTAETTTAPGAAARAERGRTPGQKQLNTRIPSMLHDRLAAVSDDTGIVIRRLVITALENELARHENPDHF